MIYRLFVYKILDTLTDSPNDLSLEWKLPVDESLAFNIGMSFLTYSQISKNIYMLLQKKLKKLIYHYMLQPHSNKLFFCCGYDPSTF